MPTLDATPHVGDVGAELVAVIVDQDDVAVDVSGATTLTIYLTRPVSGGGTETLTKTALLDGDGTDGKIVYTTISGDFNIKGTYRIQGYVTGVDGFSGSSREAVFQVNASRHG